MPGAPDASASATDRAGAVDVAVVGDGPAGTALAAALHHRGADVILVGKGDEWPATYATWVDDLTALPTITSPDVAFDASGHPLRPDAVMRHTFDRIAVHAAGSHSIERRYGVLDNHSLRDALRAGLATRAGLVERVDAAGGATTLRFADDRSITARVAVDATGWPSGLGGDHVGVGEPDEMAWQTAYGVVLDEPPLGSLSEPTMMDWRPPAGAGATIDGAEALDGVDGVPTFGYALPVEEGWLVEETVLAARPAIDPDRLRPVLARRLGWSVDELDARGRRVERVRIPMGVGPPRVSCSARLIAFGATAGMIHPATGYSVGSSLVAAPQVADAIADALADAGSAAQAVPLDAIRAAVWPTAARRTRALHEYGLDVLTRLDPATTRTFFSTFFSLSSADRDAYLRVASSPGALATTMLAVFRRAPWSLRRALVSANPRAFARVLRPT